MFISSNNNRRPLPARYDGRCQCGAAFKAGAAIYWDKGCGVATTCPTCRAQIQARREAEAAKNIADAKLRTQREAYRAWIVAAERDFNMGAREFNALAATFLPANPTPSDWWRAGMAALEDLSAKAAA